MIRDWQPERVTADECCPFIGTTAAILLAVGAAGGGAAAAYGAHQQSDAAQNVATTQSNAAIEAEKVKAEAAAKAAQIQADEAKYEAQLKAQTFNNLLGYTGNMTGNFTNYINGSNATAAANLAPYTGIGASAASRLGSMMGMNIPDAGPAKAPPPLAFGNGAPPPPQTGFPPPGNTQPTTPPPPTSRAYNASTSAQPMTGPPTSAAPTEQKVALRSPTGTVGMVPASQVAHYLSLGATRV